ncbi:hypothetical protein F4778DRAFT_739553 [Xylariomycetidae sp. FL2044]|nr:hypothetical protein F4778DRAFT_739553 [Xylariomycetidae sp. FL2044]
MRVPPLPPPFFNSTILQGLWGSVWIAARSCQEEAYYVTNQWKHNVAPDRIVRGEGEAHSLVSSTRKGVARRADGVVGLKDDRSDLGHVVLLGLDTAQGEPFKHAVFAPGGLREGGHVAGLIGGQAETAQVVVQRLPLVDAPRGVEGDPEGPFVGLDAALGLRSLFVVVAVTGLQGTRRDAEDAEGGNESDGELHGGGGERKKTGG